MRNYVHEKKYTIRTLGNKNIQEKYKKLNNESTSSLKNKEIKYYSNQLEIHKNDTSKSWKILKQIIGNDSCKSSTNQAFCIGNTSITVTDSTAIANDFNIFVSIGQKLAKDITRDVNPMSYTCINSVEHSIVITDISYTQVISTLKNSGAGWDELHTFVAKECVSGYIEPLTYLINTSFTGVSI